MRIAILNWTNRRIGGTGTYLSTIVPHLERAGYELALWHEVESPPDLDVIPLPPGVPMWSVEALGLEPALAALKSWRPDVLYAHGLLEPEVERRTLEIAPAVFFAHNYYGTCVSGAKTFKSPVVTPCDRRFGWQCLAQYYPRRCGGWSPITMVRLFRQQRGRLELLPRYKAIVTHSEHMQREYLNHGLTASRVFNVKYGSEVRGRNTSDVGVVGAESDGHRPWNLIFVGRMDRLKGGRELLKALPSVARALARPVHVTFAGDGPDRAAWESLASRVCADHADISVAFPGWLSRPALENLFALSDLLVLPSLWPEPLALVGLEAARYHLPVAAFAVGGISDWLTPGTNGFMAPGDPPTVSGLANAIVECLRDPTTYQRLREGAGRLSGDFAFENHVKLLLRVFDEVAHAA